MKRFVFATSHEDQVISNTIPLSRHPGSGPEPVNLVKYCKISKFGAQIEAVQKMFVTGIIITLHFTIKIPADHKNSGIFAKSTV